MLLDWVGGKSIDKGREQRAISYNHSGGLPDNYEDFAQQFSLENLLESIPCVFQLLEIRQKDIIDWLFRFYASRYNGDWDPHYITSLYSALRLFMGDRVKDKVACRMALEQALQYFANSMI